MAENIPKRIIQAWGTLSPTSSVSADKSADMPLFAKASAANLRLINPDFEYLFFDDSRIKQFIDDELAKDVIAQCNVDAVRLVQDNWETIVRVAEALFSRGVLNGDDLDELITGVSLAKLMKVQSAEDRK